MPSTRPRVLPAAILLAAGTVLVATTAVTADAAATPAPSASANPSSGELGAPGDLHVTAVTPTSVTLSWTPSAGAVGVVAYDVYLFDGWYTSTLVGPAFGTGYAAPFNDSTSTGLRYYYVRARDTAGNLSIASNTVQVTSPTVSPSPTLPPTAAAPACTVTYRTMSQRPGSFAAEVTVTNLAGTAVDGWTPIFPFGGDQRVISARRSTFSQTGAQVTLGSVRGQRNMAAGAAVTVVLTGRWSASNAAPTSAALNGTACTVS